MKGQSEEKLPYISFEDMIGRREISGAMNKILVGTMYPERLIEELDKAKIAYRGFVDTNSRQEEITACKELKALYQITPEYKIGAPIYIECDTDDAQKVQDIYREIIKDQPADIPYADYEIKEYNENYKEWCDDFEKKYGYRPKNEMENYMWKKGALLLLFLFFCFFDLFSYDLSDIFFC